MGSSQEISSLSEDILLVFAPSEPRREWISKIQTRYPGLVIRWENNRNSDGTFKKPTDVHEKSWQGATIVLSFLTPPPASFLSAVRFLQVGSAGIEHWRGHPTYEDKKVIFCTANGTHAPQIAEWVIGAWLSHQHHFNNYVKHMETGYWEPPTVSTVQDSTGARMGVLGYGAIGRQCARIASAMGMEVYAYTRSERSTPDSRKDDSYCEPGLGDPDGLIPARWFHGSSKDDVNRFLGQDLDLLVVSLPLTHETRGILSYEQFEILSKKKTFVANIARGGHINREALIQALKTQQIRGAALDVTDPEPLPANDPLWKAPNLLITPHVSWQTQALVDRVLGVLEVNLEKLNSGQRPINVVNRDLHY